MTTTNLRRLAEIRAAAEAVAAAAKRAFEEEARRRYDEDGMAPGGKTPDGTLTFSPRFSQLGLRIDDEQAFLSWLSKEYERDHPGQPHPEILAVLAVRNRAWLDLVRGNLAGQVAAGVIDAPAGTQLEEGGDYLGTSLTVDSTLKRRLAQVAKDWISNPASMTSAELSELVRIAAEEEG